LSRFPIGGSGRQVGLARALRDWRRLIPFASGRLNVDFPEPLAFKNGAGGLVNKNPTLLYHERCKTWAAIAQTPPLARPRPEPNYLIES
ncbi:MAG TPA: hypothetical protein VE998_12330, partial [Terriglobales bacterium]|nr:hypothetical protein [Terriglobales bacterium]